MTIETPARVMQTKAVALLRLEQATGQLHRAQEHHQRLIEEARAAGCSLRQIGQASGLSFSVIRYRLQPEGDRR